MIILDDRAFDEACERLAIAAATAKNEDGLRILWQPSPADVKKAAMAALQSLAPIGETVAESKG